MVIFDVKKPLLASVVIPAYNAEGTIAQTIRGVLSQNCEQPFEVIVVDDGSSDHTAKIVQDFSSVLYQYQKNSGPAAARNLGASKARGEFIFFLDSDCIPHPDWMSKMLPYFSESKVAAISGSYGIANPSSLLAICVHSEILYRHRFYLKKYPRVFGSYNVAIRQNVFNELGGYATKYRQASGEDNDLSYRILKAGYQILFAPQATVDHFHPTRLTKYLLEQYRHGYWRSLMYLDHPRMAGGDDYTFWKDAVEVLLALTGMMLFIALITGFSFSIGLVYCCAGGLLVTCAVLGLLEIFFALRMLNPTRSAAFYAAVMFLRAFTRTAGFLAGIGLFLPLRMRAK